MPSGWHAEERFSAERARAGELVATTFDAAPWGWKDPRASLLLPFWRAVVPGLRIVICVRNPAEVAASMMRRHSHPEWEHWLRMWLRYTADALRDSAGAERMLLLYEDLLAAPEREAERLAAFLLGAEAEPERVRAAATAVRPGTRRHAISDAAMVEDPRTPAEVAGAYLAVRAAVRTGEPLGTVTGWWSACTPRSPNVTVARRRWTRGKRAALAAELERVRAQHALVVGSRSWRVTAPLRSLARRGAPGRRR